MGLILPRNRLVYPGAMRRPGVNASHLAYGNSTIRFSAVASNGTMVNLLNGKPMTVNGAVGKVVKAPIGPAAQVNSGTAFLSATGKNETPSAVTFAAILSFVSVPTSGFLFNADNSSNSVLIWENTTVGAIKLVVNGTTISCSPSAIAAGGAYFIATSYNGLIANTVILNLATGKVYSGAFSQTKTFVANALASYAVGGDFRGNISNANFAAVMYSLKYLSIPQLLAWCNDPWSFWYPPSGVELLNIGVRPSGPGHFYRRTLSRLGTRIGSRQAG